MNANKAGLIKNRTLEQKVTKSSGCNPSTSVGISSQLLKLQSSIGNRALSGMLQAKLKMGSSNDPFEKEAEKNADKVTGNLKESLTNHSGMLSESTVTRNVDNVSAKSSVGGIEVDSITEDCINTVKNQTGQPLSNSTQDYFESILGWNFEHVRVHTDSKAAEAADSINAKAFTLGNDIVFGKNQYKTDTMEGTSLLAHELTHVIQQGSSQSIQRQTKEEVNKPKINYAKAEKSNKKYAGQLKWGNRLEEINKDWSNLWNNGEYNDFAYAVALFQTQQGFNKRSVDGVLGPATWDRLRPIGEVIADREADLPDSGFVCTIASEERLKEGYKRATGENLVPKDKRSTFNSILQSIPSEMEDVDEEYRGTGAAGALAYLGKGELVSEEEIWEDRILKPGAALQVWRLKSDYEKVKTGQNISSFGTSFIFVEYVGSDRIKVRHYGMTETRKQSEFEVWIGANVKERGE
jgi:hypothetical protein